jgi:hypothetical protein
MNPALTRYELAGRLRLHADSVQRLAHQLAAYSMFSPYPAAAADLANAAAMMRRRAAQQNAKRRDECVGHDRGGTGRCCDRAGEYNGYGSDGPTTFTCPKQCSCHD